MNNEGNKKKKRIYLVLLLGVLSLVIITVFMSRSYFMKLITNVSDSLGFRSEEIGYDNTKNDIESNNMQGAIDELYNKCLKLKEECPEGYKCINDSDINLKEELKNTISDIEKNISEISEENKLLIEEAKNAIYEDDYEKIKEIKEKIDKLNVQ